MASEKIGIGLVGCGEVAHMHAQALKRIKQAEIKAVVDKDENKARKFAIKYKVNKYYNSLSAMLDKEEEIQIVNVLTNPQSHAELAIEAMNRGKHVLVEKPMCVTLKEAEAMVLASERNNVKLFPVEQVIFTPAVQRALNFIASRKVGEITNIYAYMSVATLLGQVTKGSLPKWIYELPGGIYGELMPHVLYTTLILLAEPVEDVHAVHLKEDREKLRDACPFKELYIFMKSKHRFATIVMSGRNISRHEVQILIIECEKARIIIDLPVSITIIRDYNSSRFSQFLQYIAGLFSNSFKNLSDLITFNLYQGISWKIANQQFIESIISNNSLPFTGKDGMEWMRVTELIWKSIISQDS